MASEKYQARWVDNGTTQEGFRLPEEIFDHALDGMRGFILSVTQDPRKERVLNLYVYCCIESERKSARGFYGSVEWVNIRNAIKNFLLELTSFDLNEWERQETAD